MPIPLYQLYDTHAKACVPDLQFTTLTRARITRRAYNKSVGDPLRYVVVPGPAHPKYKP